MKKLLYVIIISLCALISFSACAPRITEYGGVNVSNVNQLINDTLSKAEMDSIIIADKLPILSKWSRTPMVDADGGRYYYYTLYDASTSTIYTVKQIDNQRPYILMKRHIMYR